MEELLLAIQTHLRANYAALGLTKAKRVYITPHVNFLPQGIRPPCIGIKDGKSSRGERMSGCMDVHHHVHFVAYVDLRKPEEMVVGKNGESVKPGVLDIVRNLHSLLDQNTLNVDGVISAFCDEEKESELFGDMEKAFIHRKIVTYKYEWEGIR